MDVGNDKELLKNYNVKKCYVLLPKCDADENETKNVPESCQRKNVEMDANVHDERNPGTTTGTCNARKSSIPDSREALKDTKKQRVEMYESDGKLLSEDSKADNLKQQKLVKKDAMTIYFNSREDVEFATKISNESSVSKTSDTKAGKMVVIKCMSLLAREVPGQKEKPVVYTFVKGNKKEKSRLGSQSACTIPSTKSFPESENHLIDSVPKSSARRQSTPSLPESHNLISDSRLQSSIEPCPLGDHFQISPPEILWNFLDEVDKQYEIFKLSTSQHIPPEEEKSSIRDNMLPRNRTAPFNDKECLQPAVSDENIPTSSNEDMYTKF